MLSCPDEALEHADAIAIGEGVQLWPQILGDIETGRLRQRYQADFSRPYSLDPAPRRSLLPRASFLTTSSVIATRGCHNRCGFCYLATDGLHMPYRMREVDQVVDEIVGDGQPYVVFVDNNLGSRPAFLRALCAGLRPLGIIWSAAVTIDITDDPSLVRDMALAGCTGVFIGFESLTAENLTDSRKRTPAPEDYARRVALLHRHGIQVNGSFVLGFDHGYAWCYDTLFSHRSIWRRRPTDSRAVLAYLAMSYLYKRSNRFWRLLIKHRLTGAVWRPLIEHSRRRHIRLRPHLEALQGPDSARTRASQYVSSGV